MAHEWETPGSGKKSFASIAVSGSRIFAVETHAGYLSDEPDITDRLIAIDRASGAIEWTIEDSDGLYNSPAVGENIVIPAGGPSLTAYHISSGREMWEYETTLSTVAPAISDGIVYTATQMDAERDSTPALIALDAETGDKQWEYPLDYYARPPAVGTDTVYVSAGALHAVNKETGKQRWVHDPDTEMGVGGVTVGETSVYVALSATADGRPRLHALNSDGGEVIWRFEYQADEFQVVGGPFAPTVADGRVFTTGRQLYALDAATGEVNWTYGEEADPASVPTYANGALYWANEALVALAPTDGTVLQRTSVNGGAARRPVVVDDAVFVTPGSSASAPLVVSLAHGADVTPTTIQPPETEDNPGQGLVLPLAAGVLGIGAGGVVLLKRMLGSEPTASSSAEPTADSSPAESPDNRSRRRSGGRDSAGTQASGDQSDDDSSSRRSDVHTRSVCPSCGQSLDGSEKYCTGCAYSLTDQQCPECETDLNGDENFCPSCGYGLSA